MKIGSFQERKPCEGNLYIGISSNTFCNTLRYFKTTKIHNSCKKIMLEQKVIFIIIRGLLFIKKYCRAIKAGLHRSRKPLEQISSFFISFLRSNYILMKKFILREIFIFFCRCCCSRPRFAATILWMLKFHLNVCLFIRISFFLHLDNNTERRKIQVMLGIANRDTVNSRYVLMWFH